MPLLLKDPDATLDYCVDWGAEYLTGDELADSRWDVEPDEPGGVTIVSSRNDAKLAMVTAGGGVAGRVYTLANHVTLASGLQDSRSVVLRVEKR